MLVTFTPFVRLTGNVSSMPNSKVKMLNLGNIIVYHQCHHKTQAASPTNRNQIITDLILSVHVEQYSYICVRKKE